MKQGHQKQIFLSVAILVSFLSAIPSFAQQSQSSSPHSTTSPTKNTSPSQTTTPKKPVNSKSTNTTPTNKPSQPTKTPNKSTPTTHQPEKNLNFVERNEGDWIKWTGWITAALITGGFTIYGLSYSRKSKLEEIRLQHRLKQETEQEKENKETKTELKAKEELKKTASQCAEKYRQTIITEMCSLSICNLPNVPSSISLESVYIELSIKEEELLSYKNQNEIVSSAKGDPNALLQKSQLHLTEKSTTAMSPVEALIQFSHIIVLGDPGAGKTTMLRFLVLKMAKRDENQLPYLPLYVDLGNFIASSTNDLFEFIATECDRNYEFSQAINYLTEQLDSGKVAFLCDGLDEVLGGENEEEAQIAYNLAIQEINRLKTRFPKAPIIVTCRKAGWRRGLKNFKTLEVLDFSWKQIQFFIDKWFKYDHERGYGLTRALSGNLRMQTLAANPLILSLITIVYQQDLELPERRAELYKRCLEVLLREWDASRNIKRFSNFTTDRKLDLLKELAWDFHNKGKRYFPENELLSIIANFLKAINIKPDNNKAILQEIAAQYGLLKEQAIGWHGFLHLTFQEYLTALAAKDRLQESLPKIILYRRDPWYTEVILLLSGMMADSTPLLLGILGHSISTQILPKGKLAIKDNFFHGDLLLAARCLVGTPIIRLRGLREKIIAEVKSLLSNSTYTFDWENAANVLMEIGGNKLENYLFDILENSKENKWRRKAITIALGNYGSHQTSERLIDFVKKETDKAKANEIVIEGVIDSLIKLKASFLSSQILSILKGQRYFYPNITLSIKSNLARALGELGEKAMVSELISILKQEEREVALISIGLGSRLAIIESIFRLSDLDQALDLLSMLSSEHADELTKLAVAMAAKFSKHTLELADSIIGYLQDESIGWQTRFVLTESLENLPLKELKSLFKILDNPDIDFRVRAGIAATFGMRRIEDVIPFLSEVIEEMNKIDFYIINKKLNNIIPPGLLIRNFTYRGYIWHRVADSCKKLNNNSIALTFIRYFNCRISELENNSDILVTDILGNVEEVIYSASIFKPKEISKKLLWLLSQEDLDYYHNDIAELIVWLVTKSLIPQLLNLLLERSKFEVSQVTWARIVYSIGQEADDRKTLETLLTLLSLATDQEVDLADELYLAINFLSRRLNLHITANGHIEGAVV